MLEKDKAILLSTWRHYVEKTANTGKRVMGFGEWMEEVYFITEKLSRRFEVAC
jgi:hypothetical protein